MSTQDKTESSYADGETYTTAHQTGMPLGFLLVDALAKAVGKVWGDLHLVVLLVKLINSVTEKRIVLSIICWHVVQVS